MRTSRTRFSRWRVGVLAVFALLVLAPLPVAAAAPAPGVPLFAASAKATAKLDVSVPSQADLGQDVEIQAHLADDKGAPVARAHITFESPASWGTDFKGTMVLGTAVTDSNGLAVLRTRVTRSGPVAVTARFAGSAALSAANGSAQVNVLGSSQLYLPQVGVRAPGLGPWILLLVIAILYGLYLLVAVRIFSIARSGSAAGAADKLAGGGLSRRQFLGRWAVPTFMGVAAAALGSGLDTIVARSPKTHANLRNYTTASGYHRTSFATENESMPPAPMPALLQRQVSFAGDVQPILLHRAGPHVLLPKNQPPPGGIRLDSYEAVKSMVVPGQPEKSGIVRILLDPSMRMPPSLPPLPDEEIQLIVTWIAQGAQKN